MQQELLFATQTQGPRLSEQTESRLINLLACLIREATMIEKKKINQEKTMTNHQIKPQHLKCNVPNYLRLIVST